MQTVLQRKAALVEALLEGRATEVGGDARAQDLSTAVPAAMRASSRVRLPKGRACRRVTLSWRRCLEWPLFAR